MITACDHSNDHYWAVFILLYEVVQSECVNVKLVIPNQARAVFIWLYEVVLSECVNVILVVPTYANACVQSFAKLLVTAGQFDCCSRMLDWEIVTYLILSFLKHLFIANVIFACSTVTSFYYYGQLLYISANQGICLFKTSLG